MNKSNIIVGTFIIILAIALFLLSLWALKEARFLEAVLFFAVFAGLVILFFKFNGEYFDTSQADSIPH